jgi:N-carbamoyl-L-amino-acid hydrolase
MKNHDLNFHIESFETNLNELAGFTDDAYSGWTREVLSEPYRASRDFVRQKMDHAGLETRLDGSGNIVGYIPGKATRRGQPLKPLMTGSHTDTVRNGGRFDGVVGVLGAIETVIALREAGVELERDLYIVDFLGEEPNRFGLACVGSRSMSGRLTADHLSLSDESGEKLGEAVTKYGLNVEDVLSNAWKPDSLHAYIELHIEQGPSMERENKQIGVVTAIAGIDRLLAKFVGEPDHAGATPMDSRHDALVAAAESVLAVERTGCGAPIHGVATTGNIESWPGSFNVVPNETHIQAEIRSTDAKWLHGAKREIAQRIGEIADQRGVSQFIEWLSSQDPVPANKTLQDNIASTAQDLGYSWMSVPSGAGHDAAHMAHLGPMGMIFVPSVNGHSHRPDEYTSTSDIAVGLHTLAETLIRLDKLEKASL